MPARKLVPEHPCPSCQQPTTNSSTCSDCNKAITEANKKRRESRREAGKCPMCGALETAGKLCPNCRQKHQGRSRSRTQRLPMEVNFVVRLRRAASELCVCTLLKHQ